MDNNDNHYSRLSEESSKITSVLHPYGLPKFDFDHTHIRFDCLAENEVFLGMSTQEDDHWIEDFSRGDSGIEFGSSAAECCSIPRHVDVWSEATSSESVEMLLKSVGQEEMLPGESIIEEPDACDELGTLAKQMEHNPRLDGSRKYQDSNVEAPTIQPLDSSPGSNHGSEDMDIEPKCSSLTKVEHSAFGCTVNLQSSLVVRELNSKDKGSCEDENQPKPGTSLNESLNCNQRWPESYSQHVREDVELSSGKDISNGKPSENTSNEPTQRNACNVTDASVCRTRDVIHSSISEFSVFAAPNADVTQDLDQQSSIPAKKESSLPTSKGNSQDLHSFESYQNSEDLACPVSLEIKHSTDMSKKSIGGSEGDLRVNEQAASSSGVAIECEQRRDFLSQTSHTECSMESKTSSPGSHNQVDNKVLTITPEGQIPGSEPEHGIHIIEDPVNHVDDLPILAVAMQSAQSVAENVAQNLKGRTGATENHEDTVLCSVSSGIVMSVEAANLGNKDPGGMSSKPVILYNDAARLSTLSLDEDDKKKIDMEQRLESDKPSTITSESNVGSNGSNAALHERSNGCTYQIADQNEKLNLLSDVESMHSEKIADPVADVILDEETSSLKFPSQIKSETGTVSLAERNLIHNFSVEEVIRDDSSLPLIEIRDAAPLNDRVMTLGFSSSMDVDSVPCDSNIVVADSTEAVAVVEHMETMSENNRPAELSEVLGGSNFTESEKASHNAASVFSSKLPASDERKKEDHIESAAEHVSDSTSKAGEVPLVPNNDGATEGSREEGSFSFDVPPVAEKESGSRRSGSQKNHGGRGVPQVTSIVTEGGSASIGAKTTSGGKTRRGPAKSTKKNAMKGNNVRHSEDNSSCGLVSQPGPARLLQFGVGITESSGRKLTVTPIPTSNLPDLNTSIPSSALFHQPFTDLQQVQLRAQIFVYGSLIQGTAPDEACMISAFGTSDGGRTSWEPKWRSYVERLHSQKTVSNYSSPIPSRSRSKGQDKSSKQSAPRSKTVPSPANLFDNQGTPSVTVKPMIPLSSPLWNLSTPLSDGLPPSNVLRGGGPEALPPLHPCQTSPAQTFGGQSTSWLSPAPIPGPLVSSSLCSAFDLSARISSSQSVDTVKLSNSSLAISSSMKDSFNDPISHGGLSSNLVLDCSMQKLTSSPVDSKSRKRRKSNRTEEPSHDPSSTTSDLPDSDSLTNNPSTKCRAVARLGSTSSHPTTPLIGGHSSTTVAETASQDAPVDTIQRRELHMENNFSHRGEIRQVEKAKQAGEEAAAHAADLVSRCQSVWSALEKQINSSIAPDRELQLSSSAAAVAAAASVAKAAAAAAKLASMAALHFHQVAIQVLHRNAIPAQGSEYSMSDVASNLGDATPASILRGGTGNNAPNSIISAARVAARRRVEAALAASQHAENLDVIVKAAELAAEAVSQAGRVVAMGKSLPLTELVEAGPENYCRGDFQLVKCSTERIEKKDIGSSLEVCMQSEGPSNLEVGTMVEGSCLQKDIGRDVSKNVKVDEPISASHISGGTKNASAPDHAGTGSLASDHAGGGSLASDHAGAGSLASDHADAESVPLQNAHGSSQKPFIDDSIKENCTVEVFKDGGCFKGAWYSAKVLSLNDEKALVCFTDLQSGKESGSLREWILLEGGGNNVPNIRVAHPISGVYFDRPRKRCRAASTEYQWSVGDRVDAWFKDCWREGVITEQNINDPTTFTVHFPAHGETDVVKAWHLRNTLTWKNGKWIGLLTSRESAPSQGDTPRAKRLRLGNPFEVNGKGEIPKTVDNLQSGNVDEPKLLSLSATENVFNIGSNRGDNKVEAPRMKRSGLQKEGLKFFGVPKPGKTRKFMDVSKHIVSEQSTKNDIPNDSSKLSKYLMPQGIGSRGFKNGSRVDVKEKHFPESKLKAPNAGKLPGILSRTLSQKENSTLSGPSKFDSRSHTVKGSISNNEKGPSNLIRSSSGSTISVPGSTRFLPPDRNKKASKNINSERIMKGKLALAGGKTEAAAEGKLLPDSLGPRRSNRKIQPTSRLLEGLQSSLITSKIPSSSHDRNYGVQSKGVSRGMNNHH